MTGQALPYGRLLCGLYGGVRPVTRKDSTAVPGLYELSVIEPGTGDDGEETVHRCSYFAESAGTRTPSRMAKLMEELKLAAHAPIVVKIVERVSTGDNGRKFINFSAVRILPAPADQALPRGRLLSGLYGGVRQVTRKDSTAVAGLYELSVIEPGTGDDGEETVHRCSYFAESAGTRAPSRMAKLMEELKLAAGAPIVVKIVERVSTGDDGRKFINFSAVRVMVPPGLRAVKAGVA